MRIIMIGGPGRSGTTYVANRIGTHAQSAHFFDIELKILSETDGLHDLRHVLCDHFSPPRATIAARRFKQIFAELAIGSFGQPKLSGGLIDVMRDAALERFLSTFRKGREYCLSTHLAFNQAARDLTADLAAIAAHDKPAAECFVEKTPHNALNIGFLHELFPRMDFLHIIRDPRAIVLSLLQQVWGPDTLEDAIQWIISYLEAWEVNRSLALQLGVRMMELRIEDLVADPVRYSDMVQDFVGIANNEHIFFDSSPDSINGWLKRLTPETLAIVNRELAPWLNTLDYSITPEPVQVITS